MTSRKCSDLVRQAHSSRVKHVNNALVEIRKKFMKTPKDVAALVEIRLVQRLLDLIRSRDSLEEQYRSKVIDVSLSILGNMCMEDVTRKQVLKDKGTGVTILVEFFEEVEDERILNRACRCLSNLLLDVRSWELISSSSVIEKIVKVLNDTENEEYKLTCIRALRLIGQTGSSVQKLVEKNAVSVVSKLIDSDTESLKLSSLRCVHSLSTHGCTLQFSSQVIASGKIPYLLTLVRESNIEAFQIVIRLCEHHNFRAEFGNAGGIDIFHEMFQSEESFWMNLRENLLSVLCLCCKEAVNRVKLRDRNILILFVQSLSDDKFQSLHARIISALVCFLYDETSFDVLLENGLVPLLVKHLKTYIMHKSDESKDELDVKHEKDEKEKQNVPSESEFEVKVISQSELHQIVTDDNEIKQNSEPNQTIPNVVDTEQEEVKMKRKEDRETCIGQNKDKSTSEVLGSDSEIGGTIKHCDDKSDSEEEKESSLKDKTVKTKPVYSIDSPSYRPNIEWEFEDYRGAKCIEKFTPPHTVDYSYKNSYSPLSNSSFYSPGKSSPEYSPPSSPNTSPASSTASRNIFSETSQSGCHGYRLVSGSQSPEYFHPKYRGICSSVSPVTSPEQRNRSNSSFSCEETSPETGSEQDTDVNVSPGAVYSQSFEDLPENPFPLGDSHAISVNSQTEVDTVIENSVPVFDRNAEVNDKGFENSDKDKDCQDAPNEEPSENKNKYVLKFKVLMDQEKCGTKRKKVHSSNNVTEYNILILLSRVSQMSDPTMHLVTKEVLDCLFDYMRIMEFPLARCPRLLSRIFRNPLCLSKVLTHGVPTMIFDKLLKYDDLNTLTKDLNETRKTVKRKSIYGKAEIHHEVSVDVDRFSVSSDSFLEKEQVQKRRRTSEDTENQRQSHSFKGEYHKQEENICNVGKSAMAFLEDLSGVVDSNYGRGAIDRLLHTVPVGQTAELCINILSITWTQESRQYFFNQRDILDEVLGTLEPSGDLDAVQFVKAINSLRVLVHAIGTKNKYQELRWKYSLIEGTEQLCTLKDIGSDKNLDTPNDVFHEDKTEVNQKTKFPLEFQGPRADLESSNSCCLLNGSVNTDTVFVVNNEKISANRAILAEKCEIFAAMLEGHYCEAQKSEIKITGSSEFAFEYLLHHLHGCERRRCKYIDTLFDQNVDKHAAEQCFAVLEESNKYLVTKLNDMANECLFQRYITPESVFMVLKHAVLHRKSSLLKASVSCLFYDSKDVQKVIGLVCEILSSRYAEIFLATLREILID